MRVKKPTTLFRAFENVFKRCEWSTFQI